MQTIGEKGDKDEMDKCDDRDEAPHDQRLNSGVPSMSCQNQDPFPGVNCFFVPAATMFSLHQLDFSTPPLTTTEKSR